jgi:hypothetical protein
MDDNIVQIGDITFIADADFHNEKTIEIGEKVTNDTIIHPDGREGMFIEDEDFAYLLTASAVLLGILSGLETKSSEDVDDEIPDLPGRENKDSTVH